MSVLQCHDCGEPAAYRCDRCRTRHLCPKHTKVTRYQFDLCDACYRTYVQAGRPTNYVALDDTRWRAVP